MTISTTYEPIQYNGNGVTTIFSFPYPFFDDSDLIVTTTVVATGVDTVQTIITDYTVSGGSGAAGSVTFLVAPASGVRVTIELSLPYTQQDDYVENQAFPADTLESGLDRAAIRDQQLLNSVTRSLKFPATLAGSLDGALPSPEDGTLLAWDGVTGTVKNVDVASLDGSFDTVFTALASGDGIKYDGANWINFALGDLAELDSVPAAKLDSGVAAAGQVAIADGVGGAAYGVTAKLCQGRLTLTSNTPVLIADVTAATTLYFTPYGGNSIALYSGTAWGSLSFSEISIAVPSTTNQMYDVFVYDNAGTAALELTAWTNDTTRATALTTQDGVYVKTGATTRRYVGSFRTTSVSGQTQVKFGGVAAGGSDAWIGVWNYYNRLPMSGIISDNTNSWNYTTATWRSANNSNTMRASFVVGVQESPISAKYCAVSQNSNAGVNMAAGVGYDSTSGPSGIYGIITSPVATYSNSAFGEYAVRPLGFHYLQALEYSAATGTTQWFGDAGITFIQSGFCYSGEF